jgi:UDP-galactopyranose mutase
MERPMKPPLDILIIGAGLSGCALGRMLNDRGHRVEFIEKERQIGGLCVTRTNEDGIPYEPYGARVFHASNVRIMDFIARFDALNGYVHRKGIIIGGKLFPFPITEQALEGFAEKERILEELRRRPDRIDRANFESACVSIFGRTLYGLFIENYTLKMWGVPPRALTADWALQRLELREGYREDRLFKNQWQGLPRRGYSHLLRKMIAGMPVTLRATDFDPGRHDVVVSSAPIDRLFKLKFGALEYRSMTFRYAKEDGWEDMRYGTINLPQHRTYVRKCNFNVLHRKRAKYHLVQYQKPVAFDGRNRPMYPVNTKKNVEIFDRYLREICRSRNICPLGRLGLFKYLDMDKAVEMAKSMVPIVERYPRSSAAERYREIRRLVDSF